MKVKSCQRLFFVSQCWIINQQYLFFYFLENQLRFLNLLLQRNEWKKFQAPKGVVTPKGRRSHTATVFQDSLYIYGGYQDLKGSTSELWAFHFGKYLCVCLCIEAFPFFIGMQEHFLPLLFGFHLVLCGQRNYLSLTRGVGGKKSFLTREAR